MFSLDVIETDGFCDLSMTAQCLYFHLGLRADDDGFVSNPRTIMRMFGFSGDDMKLLCAKGFVIPFESGVCVITHWKQHNYVRSDRYKPTLHAAEKRALTTGENGEYLALPTTGIPNDIPTVGERDTQVRLGKGSIGKDNIPPNPLPGEVQQAALVCVDDDQPKRKRFVAPTVEQVLAYCQERGNDIDPSSFVDPYSAKGWKVGSSPMKDWKVCVRTWKQRRKQQAPDPQKTTDYSDPKNYQW